ncbi:MAG: alpha/beta hydrolase, partial [Verrucomicrobiaceae bacterium]|nr:alpha/beta hydrolase [Verrucomicrobiaceae bacterium]
MPVIHSSFRPPLLLSNGHVQTILGAFVRPAALAFTRERLELPDGDFLDLDWHRSKYKRLAILSHGLEGSSAAAYIKGTARALHAAGWDALAWNMRGCSGELNRLARSYHSGATEDLRAVIEHAAKRYQSIALVGFSLGGNVTLKYLGEAPPHPAISSAACVSVPVDLRASADALDQHFWNRLYLRRFLTTMVIKIQHKAKQFPGQITEVAPERVRTLREFDDLFTAPLHGFKDAEDYWAKCSSRQFLVNLTVPTLLINARN